MTTYTLNSAVNYAGRYMYLTCKQTQNITSNSSTIEWTLTVTGGAASYYSTGATTVTIAGQQVYYAPRTSYSSGAFPAAKGSVSGSITVKHEENGKKSIPVSLTTAIYNTNLQTASGTWTLDTIPRGAKITFAPNFNDEQNPTINYVNYSGGNVTSLEACISLDGNTDDISYREIATNGSAYTFILSDIERNVLRLATLNGTDNRQVTFFVKTVIGSKTFYNTSTVTFTVINANPAITPVIADVGSSSTALTGNENTMIRGYNSMYFNFNTVGAKGASIQSYLISCGEKYATTKSGTLDYCDTNTFVFKVTDNRGKTTVRELTVPMIEYVKLTTNLAASIALSGEETSKITLKVSGNYFNGSFGKVDNTLQLKYAIKTNNAEYSDWVAIDSIFNYSENTYEATYDIDGLNYTNSYTVKVAAFDAVYYGGVVSVEIPLTTTPVFDWSGSDFNFNVPVSINHIVLDYIVEQGTKNGWSYRKWNSGKAECWKLLTLSTAATTQWGVLWKGDSYTEKQDYPFPFIEKPIEQVSIQSGSVGAILIPADGGEGVNGAYASARYSICRPASTTKGEYYIDFYICGKWK